MPPVPETLAAQIFRLVDSWTGDQFVSQAVRHGGDEFQLGAVGCRSQRRVGAAVYHLKFAGEQTGDGRIRQACEDEEYFEAVFREQATLLGDP